MGGNMKFTGLIVALNLSACKQMPPHTQKLKEVPEAQLGAKSQDMEQGTKTDVLHTSIGSSDTLSPRIQGKWILHCASPSFGMPYFYNREVTFSQSTYSEAITAFTNLSECQEDKNVSMKRFTTGRFTLVDGTRATAKVNFVSENARSVFYKDDSTFAFYKKTNPDLVLNQEKIDEIQQKAFGLMSIEDGKLCFGNFSQEKSGLSEADRPDSLDMASCLTFAK